MERLSLLVLLLAGVGCASQKSVDELRKQLGDVNSRLTKMEVAETQKSRDNVTLERAIDLANEHRVNCRTRAQDEFNWLLKQNGTPVDGKKGSYSVDKEVSKQARDEEYRAEADCQKQYEDELQAAKLKYSQ